MLRRIRGCAESSLGWGKVRSGKSICDDSCGVDCALVRRLYSDAMLVDAGLNGVAAGKILFGGSMRNVA